MHSTHVYVRVKTSQCMAKKDVKLAFTEAYHLQNHTCSSRRALQRCSLKCTQDASLMDPAWTTKNSHLPSISSSISLIGYWFIKWCLPVWVIETVVTTIIFPNKHDCARSNRSWMSCDWQQQIDMCFPDRRHHGLNRHYSCHQTPIEKQRNYRNYQVFLAKISICCGFHPMFLCWPPECCIQRAHFALKNMSSP